MLNFELENLRAQWFVSHPARRMKKVRVDKNAAANSTATVQNVQCERCHEYISRSVQALGAHDRFCRAHDARNISHPEYTTRGSSGEQRRRASLEPCVGRSIQSTRDMADRQLLLSVTNWRENLLITGASLDVVKADVSTWCTAAATAISQRVALATGHNPEAIADMVAPLLHPFAGFMTGKQEKAKADLLIGGVKPVVRVLGERQVATPSGIKTVQDIVMDIPVGC